MAKDALGAATAEALAAKDASEAATAEALWDKKAGDGDNNSSVWIKSIPWIQQRTTSFRHITVL